MHLPSRTVAVAGLLALVLGMSGCSDSGSTGDAVATAAASPATGGQGAAAVPDTLASQTLWSVEGTEEFLPDDDPDVQAVRTLVTVHSGAVDNRGPETVEQSLADEYSAYSAEFAETLDGVDWRSVSIARTTDQSVSSQQVGIGWLQSSISADRRSATAQYESYIVFTAADDAFFTENGIERGREYTMLRKVSAEKINDEWLISDVRESSLRPRQDGVD